MRSRVLGYFLLGLCSAMAILLVAAEAQPLREPPLREIRVAEVVRAEDFGAKPDDDQDDLPALRQAIEAAIQKGIPTEVVLPGGKYVLGPGGENDLPIRITKAKDLVINGQGAELIVRNPKSGVLFIQDSERVVVKDLSIDYVPRPNTQGIVKEVDRENHTLLVELAPGFPTLDEEHFRNAQVKWGLVKDRAIPRRLKAGLHNMVPITGWERKGEGTFRIDVAEWCPMERMEAGDPYVQIARYNRAPAFLALRSSRITFMDIRIYSGPGASYCTMHCSLMNFIRCTTAPRDGCWHSTGADGIYSLTNRIGPWIEGCVFDAIGDDALVIKNFGANCIEKVDDRTFLLRGRANREGHIPAFEVRAGDLLRVFDPTAGKYLGDAKVLSVKRQRREGIAPHEGPYQVALDNSIPGIEQGAEWGSPIFYNDNTAGSNFVIRNNRLLNIRRWGFLCQSHDGLVEDNVFDGTSAHAILLVNADQGLMDSDGFASRNVVIRNNTFTGCFYQTGLDDFAAMVATVVIGVTSPKTPFQSKVAPWQGQRNITIQGNNFIGWQRVPALRIGCARGVIVRENSFEAMSDPPPPPAITVFNASEVKIHGNRVAGPWRTVDAAVSVDKKTTSSVELVDNVLTDSKR